MHVGTRFDEPKHLSGAVGARLSADVTILHSLVGDALAQLIQDVTLIIAGLAIAFAACWQLALIFLALIPLVVINGYVQMKFIQGFSADAKIKYEEASHVATDAVGTIKTVASFCAENEVMELYKRNERIQ